MSFELLEFPLKSWIVSIIDDSKIKSDIFDLLGDPDYELRYPNNMLYKIEDVENADDSNMVVKLKPVDESYVIDMKTFSDCKTIFVQLTDILKSANDIFKYIVDHIDPKYVEIYQLDKLSVVLSNGMKISLQYSGDDVDIQKKVKAVNAYGFVTEIVYDDNDSDDENDDGLKDILNELVLERR